MFPIVLSHPFIPHRRCWAFSIYLEAVAILPQLFMLQKQGGAESLTGHYILLLGLYRLFYILNWIYRYATEPHYMQVRAQPKICCPDARFTRGLIRTFGSSTPSRPLIANWPSRGYI